MSTTLAPGQPDDVLELDELWAFVRMRRCPRWILIALCRRTHQVVAYALGGRGDATAQQLWAHIPPEYRHLRMVTDFWESYANVLPASQHRAMAKSSGATAHIERFNNTLRQRLARLTRKTLAFSKSTLWLDYVLQLFIHTYNQARLHRININ